MFVNNSSANLVWSLNIENAGPYFEDGTFQLLHRTGSPFQLTREGRSLSFPETTMYSGETSQLGILFAPSKLVYVNNSNIFCRPKRCNTSQFCLLRYILFDVKPILKFVLCGNAEAC